MQLDQQTMIKSQSAPGLVLGMIALAVFYAALSVISEPIFTPLGNPILFRPGAGLALAALLFRDSRLWPAIFVGTLAAGLLKIGMPADGAGVSGYVYALCAAGGATLQAVVGAFLIRRKFGAPLRLNTVRDVVELALIAAPVVCMISAVVVLLGELFIYSNVWTDALALALWVWFSSMVGVLTIGTLALFAPWKSPRFLWRGRSGVQISPLAIMCLGLCLFLTLLAALGVKSVVYQRNLGGFSAMADDSDRALHNRLSSYLYGLSGGAGVLKSSVDVTLEEWKAFVAELDLDTNFPGMNGVGFIAPVQRDAAQKFVGEMRSGGSPGFTIHPETDKPEMFVIQYIEPLAGNREALGLDIAFEANRYEAALRARDEGIATISKRISLVQDSAQGPGFLLLRPLYSTRTVPMTVDARRAAFLGWVYTPFVASRALTDLTSSQGKFLKMSVFEGDTTQPDKLIFSQGESESNQQASLYTVQRTISAFDQVWTVIWRSTPEFEASVARIQPVFVLFTGLTLLMFLGAFLVMLSRREEIVQHMVEVKTEELRAQEAQTRSIIDTAVVAIILLDENQFILSVNKAVAPIFGFRMDQLIGQPISKLLRGAAGEALEKDLATLGSRLLERRIHTMAVNGGPLVVDVHVNTWFTQVDRPRYTIILRDVTAQERAEALLRDTERRLDIALRGAKIGVFDINLDTNTSVVSDTWLQLYGLSKGQRMDAQAEWIRRIHPDDLEIVQAADRDCIEGSNEHSVAEYRVRHANGNWLWMRSDAVGVERDKEGRAHRLIGTQVDITALRKATEALRLSEEQFRHVLANAPVGMALVDGKGRFMQVNEALCNFLGYDEGQLLAAHADEIVETGYNIVPQGVIEKLITGEIAKYQREQQFRRLNGKTVWGLLSLSVTHGEAGEDHIFIAQVQDIEDRKQAENMKSQFVASVSHELRTPLTAISGSLGLVLGAMSENLTPAVKQMLTVARKNTDRLAFLVNDLLDMEKLASGTVKFNLEDIEIGSLVDMTIQFNMPVAIEYGVEFDVAHEASDVKIRVDGNRFQQVLTNLLSNAAKFSERGGRVQVKTEKVGENVRVVVIDEGMGIPQDFHGKIFRPFSQADSSASRRKGGTGLGLNISKEFVERMGGSIGFESKEGQGSVFWFVLPVVSKAGQQLQA